MKVNRLWKGFGWGVLATIVMSIFMIIGKVSGMAPMPSPIPVAIVHHLFGKAPKPLIMILALIAHLGYGGGFGALLANLTKTVTVKKAIGLSLLLWLFMQILVLPFIGWGLFGSGITLKISAATLILHIIYGIVLGLTLDRKSLAAEKGKETA